MLSISRITVAVFFVWNALANEECGLYIAESTIPGAGLGIFAGHDYNVGQDIGRGDVCIPFIDMYWHNDENFFPNPFRDYFWAGTSMGMMTETDTGDIEAYCPGLDCAVNCHQGLLNVGKSYPQYDDGILHRSVDPGVGAYTPYHNGTTKVIRDIPAGGELFKDYGPDWFNYRYHIFGQMPFSDNYDDARELLQSMVSLKSTKKHVSVLDDLYQLMRGLSKKELFDSRTLNALPERIDDAIEATQPKKDLGTILQRNYTRNPAYLREHGKCIDHIVPQPSTIPQAGRGAFATRNLSKGTIITASPLHHVPDKKFANLYNFVQVDGKWMRALDQIVGKQLVLNYCFSHPATTLMLCPYGSQINYINHDRERANVRVQWATNFAIGHNQTIIDHSAKMGQHLDRLDDLAHETSRKEAQERRQKKKERKLGKKGKSDDKIAAIMGFDHADDEANWDADDDEDDDESDVNVLPDTAQMRKRMNDVVIQFVDSLKGIRGTEPSADLFDSVRVNAYGEHVLLNTVAQITISSPTLAYANCFDPSLAKNVATAIRNQMENLNPSFDEGGRGEIKIPLPRISLETRQATVHQLRKRTEQYRGRIRAIRRSTMCVVKKGLAGKLEHVSKDDAFRVQGEIESVTEESIQKLNDAEKNKEIDIMTG